MSTSKRSSLCNLHRRTLLHAKDQASGAATPSSVELGSTKAVDSASQRGGQQDAPQDAGQASPSSSTPASSVLQASVPSLAAPELPSLLGSGTGIRRTLAAERPSGDSLMFVGTLTHGKRDMSGVGKTSPALSYLKLPSLQMLSCT